MTINVGDTVYSVKYCLTKGIEKIIVDKISSHGNVRVENDYLIVNDDCFLTKEDAIAEAKKRRVAKLQSLNKSIKRISSIVF